MSLKEQLELEVGRIFRQTWSERDGRVIPQASDVALGNDAINFARATVLYADLAGSTSLVQRVGNSQRRFIALTCTVQRS
jgi:class 3 adenylate cyclase